MSKVQGIGGIFFKSKDPKACREWYVKHLGLEDNGYGAMFEFIEPGPPERKGQLQWAPFKEDTEYFDPYKGEFMINFRVDNLEALVEELRAQGVIICDEIATYDYGKFIHILDHEGRKIELWEPTDYDFNSEANGD